MKIVQESVDREEYLELCISPREYDLIKQFMIVSKKCYIKGDMTHVGIKLELGEYDEE